MSIIELHLHRKPPTNQPTKEKEKKASSRLGFVDSEATNLQK